MKRLIAVVVLVGCSGGKYLEDYEVEPPKTEETFLWPDQVTAGNESDFAPDLSPNGAFVVYSSDKKGNKDVWEKRAAGGFARPITLHSADDFQATFSPVGKKLAFVSRREDAAGDIHIVDLGFSFGGLLASEGDLSAVQSKLTEDTNPSWFPEGDKIVFAARKPGEKTPALMTAEISDLKPQPVGEARGDQPSVSPEGRRITFVRGGAIFVYHYDGDRIEQITDGGRLQDGQPRFTPDGKALVFIRHADDTNDDGKLNGDDRPTLWRVDLDRQKTAKLRESYELKPMTSAMFAAYSPQVRPPYLYMALQTEEGLDIFRFPEGGQVVVGKDMDAVRRQFDELTDYHDKTLVLRAAQHAFAAGGNPDLAAEAALMELEWLAQNARRVEADWVHAKLKANFPQRADMIALADLAVVGLELEALVYPKFKADLNDGQQAVLKSLLERVEALSAPFAADEPQQRRVRARALFVKAKILASQRKFFDANDLLGQVVETYADRKTTSAEAAYYRAIITPATSDVPTALRAFIGVVQKYSENRNVVRLAAQDATALVEASESKVEGLVELRTNAKGLPILPAMAHMRIAEHYLAEGKEAVAANEMRQIVDLYPESPEVVLQAATKLTMLEEKAGRHDAMEAVLGRLKERFATGRPEHQRAAKNLLMDFLVRRGEGLLKQNDPEAAIKQYDKVIALEPLHVSAHRGLIDASYRRKALEPLLEKYEDEADEHPESAERLYFYGYALTYRIDEAKSPRVKISEIDECIEVIEAARQINSQILQVHQTLGWLYLQKGYWQQQYFDSGAVLAKARQKTGMVADFIGFGDPNWLELGIDSFQVAYFLADYDTIERASLAQNLGQTFFELKNYQKSLSYYMQRIKLLPIIPMREQRSEGVLWRRAGRSAFQTEELDLAETLQRQALSLWEAVGDDGEIAYSLDALALTLRERGQFREALALYERLERVNQRLGRRGNGISALSSMGYSHFMLGQYEQALERFEQAEALLAAKDSTDEDEDAPAKSGAIQVDLGGGGSAAKGFDLFARQNLVVTFKAKIYEKLERYDLALATLERKLAMLKARREEMIDDEDAPEKTFSEEIAITHNNIGEMRLAAGYHSKARDAFQEARDTARLQRPEAQTYMTSSELLNEVNRARVQLRLAELGVITADERAAFAAELDKTAAELRPVFLEGSKTEGKPLAQLLALSSSLKAMDRPAGGAPGLKESLDESLGIVDKLALSKGTREGVLLAYATTVGDQQASEAAQPAIADFRKSAAASPMLEWKLLAAGREWEKAFESLDRFVAGGGVFKSPTDRKAAREVFEKVIALPAAQADPERLALVMRRYLLLRQTDLALRAVGVETKVEEPAEAKPAAPADPKAAKIEVKAPAAEKPKDEKKIVLKSPALLRLLSLRENADIRGVLGEGEAILTAHAARGGALYLALMTKTETKTGVLPVRPDESLNDPVVLRRLVERILPDGTGRIYVVPSAELWNAPWEKVVGAKALAFLTSPDALPELHARRSLPKAFVGHLPWGGVQSETAIKTANLQRDYEKVPLDGSGPATAKLGPYHIVHVDAPLKLNDVEPSRSVLVAKDPTPPPVDHVLAEAEAQAKIDPAPDAPKPAPAAKPAAEDEKPRPAFLNDVTLKQLAEAALPQTSLLVLANVQRVNRDLAVSGEGDDGWVLLSLAAAAGGVSSVLTVERPDEALLAPKDDEDEDVAKAAQVGPAAAWDAFYKALGAMSVAEAAREAKLPGRVVGYAGFPASEEKSFAEKSFEPAVEAGDEAKDEKEWDEAASEYKKAYYYARLLGKADDEEEILEKLVGVLFSDYDYTAALYFKKKDAERRKPLGDEVDYAAAVLEAGILAVRGKHYEEADALLDTAEEIFKKANEEARLGRVYHYRGLNAQNQKKYAETIDFYRQSSEHYAKAGNQIESTRRLLDMGNVYRTFLSDYTSALEYYDKASTAFRELGKQDEFLPVQIDRANTLMAVGQLELAINVLERRTIPNIDKAAQRVLWVRATQILANAYYRAGIYQRAKELNEAAYEEADEIESDAQRLQLQIDSQSLRGMILAKLGQYREAFTEFQAAIRDATRIKSKGQVALLYNNYGFWVREAGNVDKSIDFFNIALKIDEDLKSRSSIAFDQRNLGLSILLKGDYSRARDLLTEALKTSEELNIVYNTAYCHFGLGDVAMREEKFAEAETSFRKALEVSRKGYMQDFIWRAQAGVAFAAIEQGRTEDALKELQAAVEVIEKLRAGLKSEASRNAFLSDAGVQEVYEAYVGVLVASNQGEKAWEVAERARARQFMDALGTQKLAFAREESRKLMDEERELKSQVELVERRIGQAADREGRSDGGRRGGGGNRKPASMEELQAELKAATAKYAELIRLMRATDAQLATFVDVQPISRAELAKLLPDDTALVQYMAAKDKLFIWVLRGDKLTAKAVQVTRADLGARIRDFRMLMQNYSSTEYLGKELAALLVEPVKDELAGAARLAVVPHQSLHFFPFAALPLGDGHLIDAHALYYLDGATMARFTHGDKAKALGGEARVLALANPTPGAEVAPLPFAGREPEVIGRYFPNVTAASGDGATEALVKEAAPRFDVLHIASHGIFKPSDPGDSRLLLAPGGEQDGNLSVNEVFTMATSADLVTLSACDSGLGKLSLGDEIIGMNRAFQFAGAGTVVTSLWRISDVTSAVTMKRFYRYMAEGADKAEAMRKAQQLVRKYHDHPARWASFKVVGDYR